MNVREWYEKLEIKLSIQEDELKDAKKACNFHMKKILEIKWMINKLKGIKD